MISYTKGNLFESGADALVNTVNTVGVMGKGIALQFKEAFPENYRVYRKVCRENALHVGEMLIVEDGNLLTGRKLIVNFPTKTHWRLPSEYSYIEQGLKALRKEIIDRKIRSIAIPPLGSHNGGLDWTRVKGMIEESLADLDCNVILYEPSNAIIERMKSERVKLTPARALLLAMLAELNAYGEFASVFAAEKLIYFMQRFGGKKYFNIDFSPYYYGPYSGGKISHLLYSMNGSYIKGMGGMENRPFDYIWMLDDTAKLASAYLKESDDNGLSEVFAKTSTFLNGYYSNYTLELLSTTDYLLDNTDSLDNWRQMSTKEVADTVELEIQKWSQRKQRMFSPQMINHAVTYLQNSDLK